MSVLDAPVLDDIQDKPVQGAEFQKLFVIHLVRRADVKLVIVQEVPKRIILYVQKSTEFPEVVSGFSRISAVKRQKSGETLPEASSHRFDV